MLGHVLLFLYFWDYCLITTFLPSFSPSKHSYISPIYSLLSSKFMASLFTSPCCMHISQNISCWVHITLLVCISRGWSLGTGQPVGVLLLGEGHLSCLQLSSISCTSVCRVEASWGFLHPAWYIHWCYPCSAHIWPNMLMRSDGHNFWHH